MVAEYATVSFMRSSRQPFALGILFEDTLLWKGTVGSIIPRQ